jgi:hypothetical protein
VRRCWRANLGRAKKADYVLVIISGRGKYDLEVQGVFKPERWYCPDAKFCEKNAEECREEYGVNTGLCETNKRIAFEGQEITNDVKYLHKLIPSAFFPTQNPFRYAY